MKKNRLNDDELIDAFRKNDSTKNFGDLYIRYVGKVYKTCFSLTNDMSIAEDYTQDIFIKVFEKLDSFHSRSSFSTWLYAITRNYCLEQIRCSKRLILEPLGNSTAHEEIPDETDGAGIDSIELHLQILETLLLNLSTDEATLLRLRYEHGLSIRAISEHYQLAEGNIKVRLNRTRDKLKRMLRTV